MRLIKIVRNIEAVQTVSMVPLYLQCHPEAEPKDLVSITCTKYRFFADAQMTLRTFVRRRVEHIIYPANRPRERGLGALKKFPSAPAPIASTPNKPPMSPYPRVRYAESVYPETRHCITPSTRRGVTARPRRSAARPRCLGHCGRKDHAATGECRLFHSSRSEFPNHLEAKVLLCCGREFLSRWHRRCALRLCPHFHRGFRSAELCGPSLVPLRYSGCFVRPKERAPKRENNHNHCAKGSPVCRPRIPKSLNNSRESDGL